MSDNAEQVVKPKVGFWKALAEKGKIATVIGFLFVAPINAKVVWDFFHGGINYTEAQTQTLLLVNIIGWVWVILPSSITMTAGNFKFEIKD